MPALRRQQQWLAALKAALTSQGNGSYVEGTDISDAGSWQQQGRSKQGKEKQQEVQERQLEPQQQQRRRRHLQQQRPKLDGVQTHKDWLAKQARGEANTDTHTGQWCRQPSRV
jgi:predicted transcriptional regulator